MSFWDLFTTESLQSPWVIGSLSKQLKIKEPKTKKVFILENETTDSQYEMVSKMILALKYKPEEVTLMEVSDLELSFIKDWQQAKKILLFGTEWIGSIGHFINLHGSQLMCTHSLSQLENDVELKKQTWQHLKNFEKLK